MATDRELLKSAQVGALVSAGLSDPELAVKQAHRKVYDFQLTDEGDADGTSQEYGFRMPFACRVISAHATAPINVTGHATTNAIFTVSKRVAGSATAIGVVTTTLAAPANSMVAHVPLALTITAADAVLAAGDVLTAKLTKGSTGVAVCEATATTVHASYATVTVVVEEIG